MGEKLATRAFNQVANFHVATFRLTGGRVGGHFRGAGVLLLHHRGRKSGRERVTPLLYLPDDERLVVVGSKGGSHRHPAWFLNVREMERTQVELPGEHRRVSVRVAGDDERAELWPPVVERWPAYANYQRRTEREIPLVILERA
jgi:deazaflavin-dependent oxidoreductase (nitroreductase family)